jgi:hypothetical protein
MKFNNKAFGLTCGLLWGLGVFFLTWWVILFEGTTHDLLVIGHIYRGYNVSPMGSLIGMLYGFVDGGIGGLVFSWLYNVISTRVK